LFKRGGVWLDMFLYKHLKNISKNNKDAFIQMPNDIFEKLGTIIKDECKKVNVKQLSFIYSYLVLNAFLYKYSHYVDIENRTYIQTSDIKQMLGYNKESRDINKFIKNGGILDTYRLTKPSKNYPIASFRDYNEKVNGIPIYDFVYFDGTDNEFKDMYHNQIVRNKNYEIKIPLFLFDYNDDVGTLYNYENTHKVELKEFLKIMHRLKLCNIDFMLYMYFKSMCFGFKNNKTSIARKTINKHLNMSIDAFYTHLNVLEENKLMKSNRKGRQFTELDKRELNEYIFKKI
jgi:DNA-binding transcriptional ArsR family regulator